MLACNLGLPDPLGVDVTAGSLCTWSPGGGVASLTDTTSAASADVRNSSGVTESCHRRQPPFHWNRSSQHWVLFSFNSLCAQYSQ